MTNGVAENAIEDLIAMCPYRDDLSESVIGIFDERDRTRNTRCTRSTFPAHQT